MTVLCVSVGSLKGGRHISLIRTKNGRRQTVCYHASAEAMAAVCDGVDGVVIPFAQHGAGYDPSFLLEHIRLSSNSTLQKLPVWVYCADAGESEQAAMMQGLGVGGAALIGPGGLPAAAARTILEKAALDGYVESIANRPRFDSGRHDCANAWGAYAILSASAALEGNEARSLRDVEVRLLEDTYYKKKIRFLEEKAADESVLAEVKGQLGRFRDVCRKFGKLNVFIAEDQWDDGWGAAYESVLESGGVPLQVSHASSLKESLDLLRPNLHDLVILDMRLSDDRGIAGMHSGSLRADLLSGVRLAKETRSRENLAGIGRTVPILAATASNKASTLDALLVYGINGYWVKESPDASETISDCLANLGDLYSRLADVLTWSIGTRSWIQKTYRFAESAEQLGATKKTVEQIRAKALSLNALLFQAFNPFSREMDEKLQFNVCYITTYSLLNDLLRNLLRKDQSGPEASWAFPTEEGNVSIVSMREDPGSAGRKVEITWSLAPDVAQSLDLEGKQRESRKFPDSFVFQFLAQRYGCISHREANALVRLRNKLPLVHGFESEEGSESLNATPRDIDTLLEVITTLIACRKVDG